jgi:dihydrofolate reductase
MILAHDEAGGVGYRNGLPWPHLKCDMKRFREATSGHPVLMGRKTFDSLGRKPLPKRRNIVFSRSEVNSYFEDLNPEMSMVDKISCLEDFLSLTARYNKETFVIGGAEIYKQALPYANRILLTRVVGTYPADTFYTPDLAGFKLVSKEEGIEDDKVVCVFEDYVRDVPRPFTEIMM